MVTPAPTPTPVLTLNLSPSPILLRKICLTPAPAPTPVHLCNSGVHEPFQLFSSHVSSHVMSAYSEFFFIREGAPNFVTSSSVVFSGRVNFKAI